MSTSTPLTGMFVEIRIVDDYGTTEEVETVLHRTTEDIETDRDPDEIDWVEHGNAKTQRREGAEATTTTFELITTAEGENLEDTGMLDPETGKLLRNVIHEAVRIYIFENEADMDTDDNAAVRTYEDSQFVFMSEELPQDGVGTIETEMWVHGETYFGMGDSA